MPVDHPWVRDGLSLSLELVAEPKKSNQRFIVDYLSHGGSIFGT